MLNKIFDKHKVEVLKKAVDCFGSANQLIIAVEELAELQKEITKYQRGKRSPACMAEEIADVLIIIRQLMIIYPDVTDDMISVFINAKLGRIVHLCNEREKGNGDVEI